MYNKLFIRYSSFPVTNPTFFLHILKQVAIMKRNYSEKLKALSIEELKQKEHSSKIVLRIFLVILVLLTGTLIYLSKGDVTPMIAVPISLFVVYLSGIKDYKLIKKEIAARKRF